MTETWFIALLGSMVAVMVLLFAAMLLVRRRQLLTKKTTLPNLHDSRSNGGVLATPLSLKAAVGLPHPLTTTSHSSLPHDSSLWIENRPAPNCWRHSETSDKESCSMSESRLLNNGNIVTATLNDYAETGMLKSNGSPNSDAAPAYAEVDATHASLTTFQGHRGYGEDRCSGGPPSSDGSSSPAPYATTTLVGSSRQHLNGLGWVQICPPVNDGEEQQYPSNPTCFFGRNVYSDSYFFSGRCNNGYALHSGGNAGMSITHNSCSSNGPPNRKAMSELGHHDAQLTTNSSTAPSNPTPSSASVPHTPSSTLRRGHRNLQFMRPQIQKTGPNGNFSGSHPSPTGQPPVQFTSSSYPTPRECQRFSDPPPDVITPPHQAAPVNSRVSPQTIQPWNGHNNTSGVKPMLLLTSIPSGDASKSSQVAKDLTHTGNSYNAHSLSSFAVPYPTYTPVTRHGQYQPVYHQSSRSEPGGHHSHANT